jgi:transposase, IS5 family
MANVQGGGRPPMPLERMLRIYFMQQWFNLSDPQAEDALYDMESMRRFGGIELAEDVIPDETTIRNFRHLLEKHKLTAKMFAEVRQLLEEKKLLLKSGTIVDATIISAPTSTAAPCRRRVSVRAIPGDTILTRGFSAAWRVAAAG